MFETHAVGLVPIGFVKYNHYHIKTSMGAFFSSITDTCQMLWIVIYYKRLYDENSSYLQLYLFTRTILL